MVVRLPRADGYVPDLLKEVRWLPHIGPHVVSPVPELIALGEASPALPRPWAVLSWIAGELPLALDEVQQARFAETLGDFLRSLHAVDTTGAPRGAEHLGYRCGEPVTDPIDDWADQAATALAHQDGRLAGVIDFGGLGIGDRSVDLLYAWSLLDAPAREILRTAAGSDEATWSRARAWAFVGPGLLTIAGYRHSMPARIERLSSMVDTIAAEVGVRLR